MSDKTYRWLIAGVSVVLAAADFIDNGGTLRCKGYSWRIGSCFMGTADAFQMFERSPMRQGIYGPQIIAAVDGGTAHTKCWKQELFRRRQGRDYKTSAGPSALFSARALCLLL